MEWKASRVGRAYARRTYALLVGDVDLVHYSSSRHVERQSTAFVRLVSYSSKSSLFCSKPRDRIGNMLWSTTPEVVFVSVLPMVGVWLEHSSSNSVYIIRDRRDSRIV